MRLQVSYRPAARRELTRAYDCYENEKEGLGDEFVEEIEATINRILDFPFSYVEVHRGVHRAILVRFPYSLFYRIEPKRIRIISVFHNHRNPDIWRRRI